MTSVVQPDFETLLCPRSRSPLRADGPDTLVAGAHVYPVVHGIPDLRLFDPPYVSREEERARVERLVGAEADLDYEGLVHFYVNEVEGIADARRRRMSLAHRLSLRDRAKRRLHELLADTAYALPAGRHVVLDLGCGSGEALGELARLAAVAGDPQPRMVGIDISLEELVLARKLLQQEGVAATLVAGCAEALPFREDQFTFIFSPDVIEHVTDVDAYLGEAQRTLRPDGAIVLNSPNRYSLFAPEPHNGLWLFGFLPRAWMDPASRLCGRGPYVGKRLLSLAELKAGLAARFPRHVVRGRDSNPAARSLPGRLYHATRGVSVPLAARVCPMHNVVAVK